MPFRDLRDWIEKAEAIGELKRIEEEVDWRDELGAINMINMAIGGPCLLYERIKDYPPGYRVVSNPCSDRPKTAFSLGLDPRIDDEGFMKAWLELFKRPRLGPKMVESGPCKENIDLGDAVNVEKFPVPRWNERDGGRYIGTGGVVIMRDPETQRINLGIYRVMIHDQRTLGIMISPGKDGFIIMNKYFSKGEAMPVAMSAGHEPILVIAAAYQAGRDESEYDVAGALRGEAVEVVKGEITDLPVPAQSEIIIEGKIPPDKRKREGPFGESPGYYAGVGEQPIIEVECVTHRDDPILYGAPHVTNMLAGMRPERGEYGRPLNLSAELKEALQQMGIPGIKAVNASWWYAIISLKQLYPGHPTQVAMGVLAARPYLKKLIITVDEDIDPFNLAEVMWAICTRTDPKKATQIIERNLSSFSLDSGVYPREERGLTSVLYVDACRPWKYLKDFPPTLEISPELKKKVLARWLDKFPKWKEDKRLLDPDVPYHY